MKSNEESQSKEKTILKRKFFFSYYDITKNYKNLFR